MQCIDYYYYYQYAVEISGAHRQPATSRPPPSSCQRTWANSSQYNNAAVVSLRLPARQAPSAVRPSSRTPSYQQPRPTARTVERCLLHTVGQCNQPSFPGTKTKSSVLGGEDFVDTGLTPIVQPAGALWRLAAPGPYFGRDILWIKSCSSSGPSCSPILFNRLTDTMEFVPYNREVLQNEFRYDFRKGLREISADTVITVLKAIMHVNTVNSIPAEISRGPFRKSY